MKAQSGFGQGPRFKNDKRRKSLPECDGFYLLAIVALEDDWKVSNLAI